MGRPNVLAGPWVSRNFDTRSSPIYAALGSTLCDGGPSDRRNLGRGRQSSRSGRFGGGSLGALQGDREESAATHIAIHRDLTAVGADDLLRKGESQTGSVGSRCEKRLEDSL